MIQDHLKDSIKVLATVSVYGVNSPTAAIELQSQLLRLTRAVAKLVGPADTFDTMLQEAIEKERKRQNTGQFDVDESEIDNWQED